MKRKRRKPKHDKEHHVILIDCNNVDVHDLQTITNANDYVIAVLGCNDIQIIVTDKTLVVEKI